ncbi:hypothetical protein D3Y57_00790 (plasmid) [Sphingomonas paeninsulae]|uniref:Lipoprotein n=1 Tax=Sphingomonas paeninsulae TaxID=2319844 RepID=A0A494T5L0_SPHPE|nr:hypothetical protein [Sphingomonas paeninsulae]AYJ84669.1 hypothetical protein D3Y57_00790 [Sphingomonas paeninsulae]
MRTLFAMSVLLATCACQQKVSVPTSQDLIGNRQLLAVWQTKCDTGDYSQLGATEKTEMCSSTQDATTSVAQIESGKKESDFFKASTLRK